MNYYFLALLLAGTLYALAAGGTPERIGAGVYAASCVLTLAVLSHRRWFSIEVGAFILDAATFALFCLLALRANRFWPIWASALLGLGVLGHIARMAELDMNWWAYAVILSIWSYPILALIVIGAWAHRRRLTLRWADKSW